MDKDTALSLIKIAAELTNAEYSCWCPEDKGLAAIQSVGEDESSEENKTASNPSDLFRPKTPKSIKELFEQNCKLVMAQYQSFQQENAD